MNTSISPSSRDQSQLQFFDALPPNIEDALRASIERFGVLVPVAKDQHGRTIDGHHRARIADDLGVPYRVDIITVASDEEAREIAVTLNADRRQLDPEQRRAVSIALRQAGHSYRAISGALGISHEQVRNDVSGVNSLTPELPRMVIGTDGKRYPAYRPTVTPSDEFDEDESPQIALMPDIKGPAVDRMAVHFSSESPEWYTPRHVLDAVVATMGAIDLDPCSNSASDPNVPAKHHLTQADDGLSQPWFGRVYMNPPYGREIVAWIEKLAREYLDGHVSEAVALVPARTDTAWFRALPDGLACFFSGRLAFSNSEVSAPFPSVAWYIGPNGAAFVAAFAGHGDIYQRIERAA